MQPFKGQNFTQELPILQPRHTAGGSAWGKKKKSISEMRAPQGCPGLSLTFTAEFTTHISDCALNIVALMSHKCLGMSHTQKQPGAWTPPYACLTQSSCFCQAFLNILKVH